MSTFRQENLKQNQLHVLSFFENAIRLFGVQTAYRNYARSDAIFITIENSPVQKETISGLRNLEGFSVFAFQERGYYRLPYFPDPWLKPWLIN